MSGTSQQIKEEKNSILATNYKLNDIVESNFSAGIGTNYNLQEIPKGNVLIYLNGQKITNGVEYNHEVNSQIIEWLINIINQTININFI